MIFQSFEETVIAQDDLPDTWKSREAQEALDAYLQESWKQRAVFYDDKKIDSKQQFITFAGHGGIRTNNYVGTIVFRGEQLNIYPKIFREQYNNNDTSNLNITLLVSNLVKWLSYCDKVDFPFVEFANELNGSSDFYELFATLYVRYVRATVERYPHYKYVEINEDLSTVRGKIDFDDYAIHKLPHGMPDKLRSTFSGFQFDNTLNRVIKYVCKKLFMSVSPEDKKVIRRINVYLNDVADVVCTPADCDSIDLSRLPEGYKVIVRMSRMFLLGQSPSYSSGERDCFCFLFPTERLFELFIAGFLKENYSGVATLKAQTDSLKLINKVLADGVLYGSAFNLREDIFIEKNGKKYVLDTKYKRIAPFVQSQEWARSLSDTVSISDLRQLKEYVLKRGVGTTGWLVYPACRGESCDDTALAQLASRPDVKLISYIHEDNPATVGDPANATELHLIRIPFVFDSGADTIKYLKQIFDTKILV